jgi:hypothetical protein
MLLILELAGNASDLSLEALPQNTTCRIKLVTCATTQTTMQIR